MLQYFLINSSKIICCLIFTVLFHVNSADVTTHQVSLLLDETFELFFYPNNEDFNITIQLNNYATKLLVQFNNIIKKEESKNRLQLNCSSSIKDKLCLFSVKNVIPDDAGLYTIYTASNSTQIINKTMLYINYIPNIRIRETENDTFECEVRAFPRPEVIWLFQGIPLSGSFITQKIWTGSGRDDVTVLTVKLNFTSENSTNELHESYTCMAKNLIGSTNMTLGMGYHVGSANITTVPLEMKTFNITGFIIGMIPPMFIAFYIIVHLSFKSRYAEERPEEDGMDPAIFGDPYHNLYH